MQRIATRGSAPPDPDRESEAGGTQEKIAQFVLKGPLSGGSGELTMVLT
jgi:hypothetical protein